MQGGFSTRKANPINPILKGKEAGQNVIKRDRRIPLWVKNKGMVMAVWTAEIAVREEENRADFPWPIHEGSF